MSTRHARATERNHFFTGWSLCHPRGSYNNKMSFRLGIDYKPRGDQETAIASLLDGLKQGDQHQVLLGVTGSGKTFTVAKLIEACNAGLHRGV